MNRGVGESFETLQSVEEQMRGAFVVDPVLQMNLAERRVDRVTAEDVSESLSHQFDSRRRLTDLVLVVLKRVAAFAFLYVFYSADKYHGRYLKDVEFDNAYVTRHFRRIDDRRKRAGKSGLLPLKPAERGSLVWPFRPALTADEKNKLLAGTGLLALQVLWVAVLVGLHLVFRELLSVLRRSAAVHFRQTGVHRVVVNVTGSGFVARTVRSFVDSFRSESTLDRASSTAACLPRVDPPDWWHVRLLCGLYGLMWLLLLTQAYGLRTRSFVCGVFYPRRSKKRTVFLYNEWLKKRRTYLREAGRKARQARDEGRRSVLQILAEDRPRHFGWLKRLRLGLRECAVCLQPETAGHRVCPPPCTLAYCADCWNDVRGRCEGCVREPESSFEE